MWVRVFSFHFLLFDFSGTLFHLSLKGVRVFAYDDHVRWNINTKWIEKWKAMKSNKSSKIGSIQSSIIRLGIWLQVLHLSSATMLRLHMKYLLWTKFICGQKRKTLTRKIEWQFVLLWHKHIITVVLANCCENVHKVYCLVNV